jgi:Tetratricopeptide repeat
MGRSGARAVPPPWASAEVASARERYQDALALAGTLGMRPPEARCQLGLAVLHRAEGRHDQARAALARALELFKCMRMKFWLARAETLQA